MTFAVCGILWPAPAVLAGLLDYSAAERALIESHGPWPPAIPKDPSNRVSGHANAIELGRRLFFDAGLSLDGTMSCATCHVPAIALSDGLATGSGRTELTRNTPALFNLAFARWFGWDGGADSLWGQSLRPILAPQEMAATASHVVARIADDPGLSCLYEKSFGRAITAQPGDAGLVDAGKALAAFQETLISGQTAFDVFREALLAGDRDQASRYPDDAQRGLKLFIGKGQCHLCHFGPTFSNGEFGDIGIPHFLGKGQVDQGRYGGIRKLKQSLYSLVGPYSDDRTGKAALKTRHVTLQDRNWGEFKTPSLRNVAETAPYMHNGSLASLSDVVRHYSEIDEERLHVDGEKILKPLRLSAQESGDLVAFLQSLSAPPSAPIRSTTNDTRCRTSP